MSTAGRMIAGAVAGVSKFGLDQIENRQEEEREVRKAKLLETLRRDTATQLATFEEKMRASRADKNFSGVDGDDFVTRDAEGREKGRRKLTVTEREEMDRDRTKSNLDIENTRSQINSRSADTELSRQRLSLDRQRESRQAAESSASLTGKKENRNSFAQGLVNRYKDFLGGVTDREGAPLEGVAVDEFDAFELANEAIDYAADTGGNSEAAENYFLQKLKERRRQSSVIVVE